MKFSVAILFFTCAFMIIDLCSSIYEIPRDPPRIQIDPIRGTNVEIRQPDFPIIEMRPSVQNDIRGFHDETNPSNSVEVDRNNLNPRVYQPSPRRLIPGYRQRILEELEDAARLQNPNYAESSRQRENSAKPTENKQNPINRNLA